MPQRWKRYGLLTQLFGRIGENVCVDIDFHCEYGKHILCGNRVIINMNCTFVDNNIIEIGDDVLIASNVQIYTATHSTRLRERIVTDWKPLHSGNTYADSQRTTGTDKSNTDSL